MSNLSPAPGVPQSATKSWVSAIGTGVVAFVGFWIADTDPFTAKEIGQGALLAVVGSGLVGGATYQTKNTAK